MTTERLYQPPSHTNEVLQSITTGSSTVEAVADDLNYTPKTVSNKVHDAVVLGLVERDDNDVSISGDARRIVQLKDKTPYRERFKNLTAVPELLERISEDALDIEEVGRIVSFETGSNAGAVETFRTYGRVYAEWINYLDIGTYSDGMVASSTDQISLETEPLENPRGANCPRVAPKKVLKMLPYVSKNDSRKDIESKADMSEKTVGKTLSTCYALGLAEYTQSTVELTDRGKEVQQASVGNRKKILSEELLQIPLVQAYCARASETEFTNFDVMQEVSEENLKGWNDQTVRTRAKRLSRWLQYTELAEEVSRGSMKLDRQKVERVLN